MENFYLLYFFLPVLKPFINVFVTVLLLLKESCLRSHIKKLEVCFRGLVHDYHGHKRGVR